MKTVITMIYKNRPEAAKQGLATRQDL